MDPNSLNGRKVVDGQGKIIGQIAGIDIDLESWKVVKICVNLSDDAIEKLGYEKKFLGKVQVDLPIEVVKSIRDVAVLSKSMTEIKDVIEPCQES